ncbi:acyl-CoA dehydrogenase family protein [Methylobacterium oryzisoli]|uniref:acyl-CoA dehydrogenase family protein n=1 Tax=Methylobacterium oryzisoli TaxID=3385502 RepID=UPI0038921B0A
MLRILRMRADSDDPSGPDGMLAEVRSAAARDLAPLVRRIDEDGLYPEAPLRAFGAAGAFSTHLPAAGRADLGGAIQAAAEAGEHCLTTAVCMACQGALALAVACSDNAGLRADLGPRLASGAVLGGIALADPIETLAGLARPSLAAERVAGGYRVSGSLPWVSNLGPGHLVAAAFERPVGRLAMAVLSCEAEGVRLVAPGRPLALGGARTYTVQLQNVLVADENLLADPMEAYFRRIRPGLLLLQAGTALGLGRACLRLMREAARPHGLVNGRLALQPRALADRLDALEDEVGRLAATPFEADPDYWRSVLEVRLALAELAVEAAQSALMHDGSRGLLADGEAQRRLREAAVLAVAPPATKHLLWMLAEL